MQKTQEGREAIVESNSSQVTRGLFSVSSSHTLVHGVGNIRNTLLPILKEDFGINNYQVGILSALPPLLQAVFSLPAGWISDRYGSKKVVFGSLMLLLAGSMLAAFSRNPWTYVFSAILLTVSSTIFHPPAFCYIADVTKPQNRSKYNGLFNAGGTLGMSLGPLSITVVVGMLALHWNRLYLFWAATIILGLLYLWSIGVEYDIKTTSDVNMDEKGSKERGNGFLNKEFLMYISSRGIRTLGIGMFTPFLSIYLHEIQAWPIIQIGLMMGISGVLGLFCAPLGGVIASKLGEKRFVIISTILSAISFLAAFYSKGVIPFMVFYLGYRVFVIMAMPGQATITARLSPPKQIGMGFALTFLPASITGVISPLIAAGVIELFGYLALFNISAFAMILATVLFWVGIKSE
jgi:MFS family permease